MNWLFDRYTSLEGKCSSFGTTRTNYSEFDFKFYNSKSAKYGLLKWSKVQCLKKLL